jgi:single-strand DNA-binding protein
MASLNKIQLIGHVGQDPIVKTLQSGSIVNLTLAVSEKYKNKSGEVVSSTEWFNLTAFGTTADVINKYVTKGQLLYVEGKIKTETWDKDGQKQYKTVVIVQSVQMLSKNETQEQKPVNYGNQSPAPETFDAGSNSEPDLDLPF